MSRAKLVRDKVPDIIRSSGVEPYVRIADGDEYKRLLREKLHEEVEEFLESNDPGELADVLEVLHALILDLGLGWDRLEKLRAEKADERGGFAKRLVWSGNSPAATYASGLTSSASPTPGWSAKSP